MTFEQWFAEVIRIGSEKYGVNASSIDAWSWKDSYFDNDLSPDDAWLEEIAAAQ